MPRSKRSAKKKLPQAVRVSKSAAAGLAAATRGRARVIEDPRKKVPPARKQISEELSEIEADKKPE